MEHSKARMELKRTAARATVTFGLATPWWASSQAHIGCVILNCIRYAVRRQRGALMSPSVNFQSVKVTTRDGVGIDAQVWGYPSRFEVLFVHGMLQCHLSWLRQVEYFSPRNFRLT